MREIDNFYLMQDEPIRGCLLALKEIILSQDINVSNTWKYTMPFFCYKRKMFCYLWIHKKYKQPYLGIVKGAQLDNSELLAEKRTKMKIMLFDPAIDLPFQIIESILQQSRIC